ncbi:hypothetical protein LX99_04334 [Mucilaginibacter oryzae]|uniref:Uncharacterized protein n=1 Tax=Mucilaginibacter oryzae TaxID=468058 RepID=A0A316H036_9SPHI|nr:hypothetical protein [Mucilaginibacter oryzae]PWK72477.1 hypothetical protein LX99_04334 [Mucilaginibacter oryzae]
MKKPATIVSQPDKTETTPATPVNNRPGNQKMYRDHSHCDHSHGRVNKFAIGSNRGPCFF